MRQVRDSLTYANVVATLALFIAIGGASAFAASHLGKNSVGTKQLKKNAVITAKIKKEAVTGAKVKKGTLTGTQIKSSTLGAVPLAETANSIAAPESWREVGAPGEPAFQHGWKSASSSEEAIVPASVAFYKDREGMVHLRGAALSGSPGTAIFQLPPGYRPATGKLLAFTTPCSCGAALSGTITVTGEVPPFPFQSGVVAAPAGANGTYLDGISFRAES